MTVLDASNVLGNVSLRQYRVKRNDADQDSNQNNSMITGRPTLCEPIDYVLSSEPFIDESRLIHNQGNRFNYYAPYYTDLRTYEGTPHAYALQDHQDINLIL